MWPDRVSNPGPLTCESGAVSVKTLFIKVLCIQSRGLHTLCFRQVVWTKMLQIRPKILSNYSANLTGHCNFNFCMLKDFFLL